MAAVLARGVGAVLSHRSAAELSGLMPPTDRPPEVTLTGWRRRRAGVGSIRWHSSAVPVDEITVLAGIPVTIVPRTLLDLAAILDRRSVERAIDEAEIRRYADALSLPELLARYPRRRGTATIRAILDLGSIGTTRTRSEWEERFPPVHRCPRHSTTRDERADRHPRRLHRGGLPLAGAAPDR
jgi:hypothetical protein